MPQLNDMLRRIRLQAINVSVPGTDGHLATMHRIAGGLARAHPDLHYFTSTFDLRERNAPGWAEATTKALDQTFAERHADIIGARDRILEKHPTLVVDAAHLASLEHDVAEVARRLDRYPNLHVEVAARTRDLTYQPTAKVRDFFLQYQDRILYGVDRTWMPYARETPPTDEERSRFVQDLEAQYRLVIPGLVPAAH